LVEGDWGSVRALSAGQFHSAILNTKGEVWTFGWGVWGQLGIGGRQIKDCLVPTKVPNLSEPIKEVSCGRVHTVLLTVSGKVLVAGSGSYGQLGTDEDIRKQYDFRPLPIDPSLKVL
ncbi:regulator of condensation, partial [Ostertagia ostertagi]